MSKILEIIVSSGVSTGLLVVLGFILRNWFLERLKGSIKQEYAKDLEDHKDNLRKETDTELTRLSGNVSVEVEKAKLKMSFYSEKQFDLYNELWLSLCKLKNTMNELWAHVDDENLRVFQKQLLVTDDLLEQKSILIEPDHYDKLRKILNQFGSYRLGKKTLIDLREEQGEIRNFDTEDIRSQIHENGQHRQELLDYLPQMRDCLRSQICGQANTRGNQ